MADKCANCGKKLDNGCLSGDVRFINSSEATKFLEDQGIRFENHLFGDRRMGLCKSCFQRFDRMMRSQRGRGLL